MAYQFTIMWAVMGFPHFADVEIGADGVCNEAEARSALKEAIEQTSLLFRHPPYDECLIIMKGVHYEL